MARFKRKVFYVGGFDPRGPRFYHALAAEQVARWAERTGEAADVSTRRATSEARIDWTIRNRGRNDDRDVTTEYAFLRWDDLVRTAWIGNPFTFAIRAARATFANLRQLDFATGRPLGKGPLITLFYPPLFAILLPLLIALPVAGIAAIWLAWYLALPIGLVVGILAARPLLVRMHVPWLLRFFVFNADLARAGPDATLSARLDAFADEIAAGLEDGEADEIVLLTHSNGSILCMPLMARLLDRAGGRMPERFALVTMGHCIPLLACRRDAHWFHAALRRVATGEFRWFDIGSPPDGAAYSGIDPMRLVEPAPRPALELLSPRFHLFYDPATYHRGYANKYEIHFDYLRMGDRVSEIDWPSLMAHDRPIAAAVAAFRANH